jgi:ABC-type uncharacterized transport system substrate-binding protein
LTFVLGQQQATGWRCVLARQASEFLVEILKAQAEAQGLRVFEEEFSDLGYLGRRFCLGE